MTCQQLKINRAPKGGIKLVVDGVEKFYRGGWFLPHRGVVVKVNTPQPKQEEKIMTKKAYLTGDTFRVKSILKDHGWKWDADKKAWWKEGEWASESQVITTIRCYGGIRNRGRFEAELEK